MKKKLYILQIFSNFVIEIKKQLHQSDMYNFFAKFGKILDVCKHFSKDLVNEHGNMPRRGVVPKFSDLEVIALALTAETESIDSESRLFSMLKSHRDLMPNLISRRQYNDRRKYTAGLCEDIRKRLVGVIDGGEDYFCIDSKPIEVCRLSRGKRCKMGRTTPDTAPELRLLRLAGRVLLRLQTPRPHWAEWRSAFLRPLEGKCPRPALSQRHQAAVSRLQHLRGQRVHQRECAA